MHLHVQRQALKDDRTLGEMLIDGQHFAWTLEDKVREVRMPDGTWSWHHALKVPGQTAIPAGVYEIATSWSNRFGRLLPILFGVPDFTYIRCHGLNGPTQTEGCIGTGAEHDDERIWNCSGVVSDLTFRIRNACSSGKVYIEVTNP